MTPIDFRNATFDALKQRGLEGLRGRVLAAWRTHGPCTTRELAAACGIDVLSVRPRTTELVELGFVVLAETQPVKGEGTYRAASESEAFDWLKRQRQCAISGQTELSLLP